jgi:hypothetical protein
MTIAIRAANVHEGRNWWVVVPFAPTFGVCSPEDQEHVIHSMAECVDGVRRRRMEGVVVVAWRESGRVRFTGPRAYPGPFPKISWPELLRGLVRQFHCDDPFVVNQLRGEG